MDEFLAVDLGEVRVGVARGSSAARIAEPVGTYDFKDFLDTLPKLIVQHQATAVVVGLPRGLDGQETDQTRWVKDWLSKAKPNLNVPIYLQDEALSTHQASQAAPSKHGVDAMAASVILQDFLDSPSDKRVVF